MPLFLACFSSITIYWRKRPYGWHIAVKSSFVPSSLCNTQEKQSHHTHGYWIMTATVKSWEWTQSFTGGCSRIYPQGRGDDKTSVVLRVEQHNLWATLRTALVTISGSENTQTSQVYGHSFLLLLVWHSGGGWGRQVSEWALTRVFSDQLHAVPLNWMDNWVHHYLVPNLYTWQCPCIHGNTPCPMGDGSFPIPLPYSTNMVRCGR